jgi:hypothetical protein
VGLAGFPICQPAGEMAEMFSANRNLAFSCPFSDRTGFRRRVFQMEVELKNRSSRGARVTLSLVASATVAAFILALAGSWPYSTESFVTGPASSIGKSGEMKSPGGQMSDSGPYRGQ